MIEATSFWELVERRADATPEELFARDESGRELSFGSFRGQAERVAAALFERGVRADSVVSWILPTRLSAAILMAALARLGAVQNPILPIYRHREVGFCVRQTRSSLLIAPKTYRGFDFEAMLGDLAAETSGLAVEVIDPDLPTASPSLLPPAPTAKPPRESPVRWIFYTSGTESDPKGARHVDASILASSRGLALAMDLQPSDRIGLVFPITHLGGANSLTAGLMSGCAHLLVETFQPETTIAFLSEQGVTHAGAGTVFHRAYLEAQRAHGKDSVFSRIRAFQGGGSPKPPQLHFDLKVEIGGAGILSAYGMTECPIISVGSLADSDDKLAHTEGRINVPGTEVRVLAADGSHAPPGDEGELLVRAPQLLRGYVDASLDRDAFDTDGYLRTGDRGFLDADGYLIVTGRTKDVIIRKGENISAREVEDLLMGHPKVADVAVIGIPELERGERCCAVVTCRSADDLLAFEEMAQFLRESGLMLQKIPEQLEIVGELPRNASGKVLKAQLRDRFANGVDTALSPPHRGTGAARSRRLPRAPP